MFRPSGRRILTTRRPRRTRSPFSLTVVTLSSSRTTAFTSSAYVLGACLASARSQSGTSACVAVDTNIETAKRKIALIAFLGIGAASCMQNGLLFVAGLDFTEKRFQFRISFYRKKNRIKYELPLGDQLETVKVAYVLIACVGQLGVL